MWRWLTASSPAIEPEVSLTCVAPAIGRGSLLAFGTLSGLVGGTIMSFKAEELSRDLLERVLIMPASFADCAYPPPL
jgi:hypothetical protein